MQLLITAGPNFQNVIVALTLCCCEDIGLSYEEVCRRCCNVQVKGYNHVECMLTRQLHMLTITFQQASLQRCSRHTNTMSHVHCKAPVRCLWTVDLSSYKILLLEYYIILYSI